MKSTLCVSLLAGILLHGSLPAAAQTATPLTPIKRAPLDCTTGPATEIAFWIGTWKVTDHKTGGTFGVNRFTKLNGGCAVHEEFKAKRPNGDDYLGTSLSFYDPAEQQWYQFYVDSNGRRSLYSGKMVNGEWVMVAPMKDPTRGPYLMRMIVRLNPDGSVKQLGAVSVDDGKTWLPTFDLDYTKI